MKTWPTAVPIYSFPTAMPLKTTRGPKTAMWLSLLWSGQSSEHFWQQVVELVPIEVTKDKPCKLNLVSVGWTDWDKIWHRHGPQGGGSTQYPHTAGYGEHKGVRGASGASTVRFSENFIKQKLQGTLLDPKSRTGSTWSRGHSLSRGVYNTKVVVNVPNSAWPMSGSPHILGPGRPMSGYPHILYSSN